MHVYRLSRYLYTKRRVQNLSSHLREVDLVNSLPESHALEAGQLQLILGRLAGPIGSLVSGDVSIKIEDKSRVQ